MKRVLVTTDQMSILPDLVAGYARCGAEAVGGVPNFFLRSGAFDLVHCMWPEELSAWQPPSETELSRVREAADWWAENSCLIMSVNNLHPHGAAGNPAFRRLYEILLQRCALIVHHCATSKALVCEEYPVARSRRHVVTTMCNFDQFLPPTPDRDASRRHFGHHRDDFVVLVFGALRFFDELRLIRGGFDGARVPGKRLLMGGRYVEPGGRVERRWKRLRWHLWLRSRGTEPVLELIPKEAVHRYFEAADAIIVPRIDNLGSGVVGVGCSFGKMLIVPDHGAYRDYLAGTENPVYPSGDPDGLARAIERAASMDTVAVGQANRELADTWTWDRILRTTLKALGQKATNTMASPPRS